MSTFLYSSIANGERVDFDPSQDVLSIDSETVSAADFSLTVTSDGEGIRFTSVDKQFTLGPVNTNCAVQIFRRH